MTHDPQDACAACGHARHLHYPDSCVFARDVPGEFCRCESFVEPSRVPAYLASLGEFVQRGQNAQKAVDEILSARVHDLGEVTPEEGRAISRKSKPRRAPPREPPLPAQRVAEMLSEIAEMRAVQTRIYHVGLKMHHGEWQAFAALVSVFASMCEIVIEQGYDYAFEAECAVTPEFKAKYLGQKFRRVFGPFLSTPENVQAFLEHAFGAGRDG